MFVIKNQNTEVQVGQDWAYDHLKLDEKQLEITVTCADSALQLLSEIARIYTDGEHDETIVEFSTITVKNSEKLLKRNIPIEEELKLLRALSLTEKTEFVELAEKLGYENMIKKIGLLITADLKKQTDGNSDDILTKWKALQIAEDLEAKK